MPLNIPLIRIFLSSLGDVAEERRLAQQVIQELPNQPVFRNKVKLAVIAWDDLASSTLTEASLTSQAAINKRLPQPSQCDITDTIFFGPVWARRSRTKTEHFIKVARIGNYSMRSIHRRGRTSTAGIRALNWEGAGIRNLRKISLIINRCRHF
ncbi:MAG: hypothetical protein K8L91_16975 [Anaerolineae bacterium]|nr:hypothetical protein [Anaerolineae bacterium]